MVGEETHLARLFCEGERTKRPPPNRTGPEPEEKRMRRKNQKATREREWLEWGWEPVRSVRWPLEVGHRPSRFWLGVGSGSVRLGPCTRTPEVWADQTR
uniref:Uncharacterized protein n=1 Tax=Leersia perrieri TaxID=77586 RepID=A0A0D9W0U5_9ORYZ